MTDLPKTNVWLHRYAVFTALWALGLIAIGGLVTSNGVGMAVPDWPTSYGYNMFALPFSIWFTGGVFHEHTHREGAVCMGIFVIILMRWLGGEKSRRPLLIVGGIELVAGLVMFKLNDNLRGTGGFLCGVGASVILAGIAWFKNVPSARPLPAMGWWAFWLVQLQGLLGGLRVLLDAHMLAGIKLGTLLGIFHACLAQGFFVLLCAIALMTSKWWKSLPSPLIPLPSDGRGEQHLNGCRKIWKLVLVTTVLIFIQLTIGATMRHQHAGLAVKDFPLAYGKLWPDTSPQAVARYNSERVEVTDANPITAFQINLHMVHRTMALIIFCAVAMAAWQIGRTKMAVRKLGFTWIGLIFVQIGLGAWTVLSDKAADIATLHVVVGALSLVTGAMLCIILSDGITKPNPAEA